MRSRFIFSVLSLLAIMVLPQALQAQCGTCEPDPGWREYRCVGPVNNPDKPPFCSGTMILGIACQSCGRTHQQQDAAVASNGLLELPALVLDGSFPQEDAYSAVIGQDPHAGLTSPGNKRTVVFFPCSGAIAARRYDQLHERKLRLESTLIQI